jgi:hypothetical protein
MQGAHPSTGSPSSMFASVLASSHSLFTPKRVGFTLAGAFVFVGAAAAMNGGVVGQDTKGKQQNFTVQTATDSTADQASSSGESVPGSTSNTSSTNVQVNVNGQNIAVPENGSVQQTVPTQDGTGQSSVSVKSSNNNSSSSLNVNISSNSSSTGNGFSSSNTMVSEDGGSTFISNN